MLTRVHILFVLFILVSSAIAHGQPERSYGYEVVFIDAPASMLTGNSSSVEMKLLGWGTPVSSTLGAGQSVERLKLPPAQMLGGPPSLDHLYPGYLLKATLTALDDSVTVLNNEDDVEKVFIQMDTRTGQQKISNSWKWEIRSTKTGPIKLHLDLGYAAPLPHPSYQTVYYKDLTISVRRDPFEWIGETLGRVLGRISAVVYALIIFLLSCLIVFRVFYGSQMPQSKALGLFIEYVTNVGVDSAKERPDAD